jgi:Protein of unknown function (DUF5663)
MMKLDHLVRQAVPRTVSDEEIYRLAKLLYPVLEMRVGIEMADRMTNEQLEEFGELTNAGDAAGALQWLNENWPDHKFIVQAQVDKLMDELLLRVRQSNLRVRGID